MQEKERKQQEEVEAARDESSAASEAFSVVRRQRQDTFCAAFEHVAGVIDGIFKGALLSPGCQNSIQQIRTAAWDEHICVACSSDGRAGAKWAAVQHAPSAACSELRHALDGMLVHDVSSRPGRCRCAW